MLNIINDIISILKMESGLMEINMQESNINEQIEYIYTFFKPEIEGKGSTFYFTLKYQAEIIKNHSSKNEVLPPGERAPMKQDVMIILQNPL